MINEIEGNWDNLWADIVYPDNKLDLEQLKKELFDYSNLMDRMSEITDYISNGQLSKPTYDVGVLKNFHDEEIAKYCKELKKEVLAILKAHGVDKEIRAEIENL